MEEHYVYLYRDKEGKPIYVGYGRYARRSSAHIGANAHNKRLTALVNSGGYSIEIAGPFGNENTAKTVESALISALMPAGTLANNVEGHRAWRFRPMGVPPQFVDRLDKPLLTNDELTSICRITNGILLVMLNDKDMNDGRPGDVLANPPSDAEIAKRMDRWWQLAGRASRDWVTNPQESPGLLVALSGTGDFRIVVGSLSISKIGWYKAVQNQDYGGLITIPHDGKLKRLDAQGLRGRRLDPKTQLRFGALRHQQFILFDKNGRWVAGGNKTLRKKMDHLNLLNKCD